MILQKHILNDEPYHHFYQLPHITTIFPLVEIKYCSSCHAMNERDELCSIEETDCICSRIYLIRRALNFGCVIALLYQMEKEEILSRDA